MQSHIEPERLGFTEPKRRRLLSVAGSQEARWLQQGSEQQVYETGGGTKLHTPFQQRRYAEEVPQDEPSTNQMIRHLGQGDQIDQPREELLVAEQYWADTRSSCKANSFPSLLNRYFWRVASVKENYFPYSSCPSKVKTESRVRSSRDFSGRPRQITSL